MPRKDSTMDTTMAKITLCGGAGTGKGTVGPELAAAIAAATGKRCEFVSFGQYFRARAVTLGISQPELEELAKTDPTIDQAVDRKLQQFGAEHENYVIDARLGWYFLPLSFKVLLICKRDVRIQRVADRDGISFEMAQEQTNHREKATITRYNNLYSIRRLSDRTNFNLVVDTTTKSVSGIVEKILRRHRSPAPRMRLRAIPEKV